jgi:hypothetical protein
MAVQSAIIARVQVDPSTFRTTLLELVTMLSEMTESEEETVKLARALLADGTVELTGSFRGCSHELLA